MSCKDGPILLKPPPNGFEENEDYDSIEGNLLKKLEKPLPQTPINISDSIPSINSIDYNTKPKHHSYDEKPLAPMISSENNIKRSFIKVNIQSASKQNPIKIGYEDDNDEAGYSIPTLNQKQPEQIVKEKTKPQTHFFIDVKPQWESINRNHSNSFGQSNRSVDSWYVINHRFQQLNLHVCLKMFTEK